MIPATRKISVRVGRPACACSASHPPPMKKHSAQDGMGVRIGRIYAQRRVGVRSGCGCCPRSRILESNLIVIHDDDPGATDRNHKRIGDAGQLLCAVPRHGGQGEGSVATALKPAADRFDSAEQRQWREVRRQRTSFRCTSFRCTSFRCWSMALERYLPTAERKCRYGARLLVVWNGARRRIDCSESAT